MSVFSTDAMCAQPASSASLPALYSLRIDVDYLSVDLVRGHETGTEGEHLAAQYLVQRVRERGLAPGLDSAWTQPFDVTHSPNPHAPSGHGRPGSSSDSQTHPTDLSAPIANCTNLLNARRRDDRRANAVLP